MSVPARVIREWEESQGVDRLGPIVTFYDYALPDNQAARDYQLKGKWSGERPRFKPAVFVEMKTRNDPTGSTFCQQATEQDKETYPKEWALYCEARKDIEHRAPPLAAIPAMNPAAFEELKALGVTDCRKFVEYEGDLDELEPMRQTARRILEAANEDNHEQQNRGIRRERESVPQGMERPLHSEQPGTDWPGGAGTRERPSGFFAGDPTGGPGTIERDRGTAGRLPSNNQGGQPVQERPEGGKRLLRGSSVEVFKYENLVPNV